MRGGDAFHLDLVFTIAGIDVIELLLPGRPRISNRRAVERFGNPQNAMFLRNPEPEIVKAAPPQALLESHFTRRLNRKANDRTKFEIVANTAGLIVDSRLTHGIGIDPPCTIFE